VTQQGAGDAAYAGATCPSRRTVCRRAERSVVELAESQAVSNTVRQYLNRLSDLMFVMARVLNRTDGGAEHQWDRTRND
jgi:cob(I)alamin adenosyltransferase